MRFKWILILLTVMFVIVSFSKRHTQKENVENVKNSTNVITEVDSTIKNNAIIPVETIDTLHTNL